MRMRTTIGLSLALLIVSATAWAKQVHAAHHHVAPSAKAKHARTTSDGTRTGTKRGHASGTVAVARAEPRPHEHLHRHLTELPPPDRYVAPVRVIGPREIGKAAWYGGRHLGRRTASGEPLDSTHPTAAHRSLPLHSLVRVTNLSNGRSALATINDRGPVSRSLLIDVSPRVAEALDMMGAGVAKVVVEPVAAAGQPAR
jgi:rare lipoprotein A